MLKVLFTVFFVLFAAPALMQAADHHCPNCGRVVSSNVVNSHVQPIESYATPVYEQAVFQQPVVQSSNVAPASYSNGNTHDSAYSHAVRSANYRASRGIKGHGMTGGYTEGVGFSTISAQDAIRRCCYSGSSMNRRVSVVRGSDGWYATSVYTR